MVLSTTSNRASGNGSVSTTAVVNATSIPALADFLVAFAIIAGDASMPNTAPPDPTLLLAAIASVPVPQPTSRTVLPGSRDANWIIRSRRDRSRPRVNRNARKSYSLAPCSTRPVVACAGVCGIFVICTKSKLERRRRVDSQRRRVPYGTAAGSLFRICVTRGCGENHGRTKTPCDGSTHAKDRRTVARCAHVADSRQALRFDCGERHSRSRRRRPIYVLRALPRQG